MQHDMMYCIVGCCDVLWSISNVLPEVTPRGKGYRYLYILFSTKGGHIDTSNTVLNIVRYEHHMRCTV